MSIYTTPRTVQDAFDATKEIIDEERGRVGSINLSSIASKLIQECGRWTDRYASDFLIDWDGVREITEGRSPVATPHLDRMFIFAIRRDGVDHMPFFMSRIREGINPWHPYLNTSQYRRILALQVTIDDDNYCHCVLKNIENQLTVLHADDVDWGKETD